MARPPRDLQYLLNDFKARYDNSVPSFRVAERSAEANDSRERPQPPRIDELPPCIASADQHHRIIERGMEARQARRHL